MPPKIVGSGRGSCPRSLGLGDLAVEFGDLVGDLGVGGEEGGARLIGVGELVGVVGQLFRRRVEVCSVGLDGGVQVGGGVVEVGGGVVEVGLGGLLGPSSWTAGKEAEGGVGCSSFGSPVRPERFVAATDGVADRGVAHRPAPVLRWSISRWAAVCSARTAASRWATPGGMVSMSRCRSARSCSMLGPAGAVTQCWRRCCSHCQTSRGNASTRLGAAR